MHNIILIIHDILENFMMYMYFCPIKNIYSIKFKIIQDQYMLSSDYKICGIIVQAF